MKLLLICCVFLPTLVSGQIRTSHRYAPDSGLVAISHADTAHFNSRHVYSDSIWLIIPGDTLKIVTPHPDSLKRVNCKPATLFTSNCSVFQLPEIVRIYLIRPGLYAVLGYFMHAPSSTKHIWIVSVENRKIEVIKRIGFITHRNLQHGNEINFAFDDKTESIVINSRENDITDHHIYTYGHYWISDKIKHTGGRAHFSYKYWKRTGESRHSRESEEYFYTIPIAE